MLRKEDFFFLLGSISYCCWKHARGLDVRWVPLSETPPGLAEQRMRASSHAPQHHFPLPGS